MLSLGCILVLGIGGVQTRYGSAAVSGTVLLGIWLLLANILVLTGYQTCMSDMQPKGTARADGGQHCYTLAIGLAIEPL